ncbi:hypothetical protein ACFQ3P_38530 [Paraburkholderia sabiae]|uniref:Uncharacterized protein n=1 Tax=Paraburkholderia sabiae TaxID=273251 RepID=A0ABU9QPY0_9BURK|nr:hypothetical protein [Paraburkholderia sabiae]WJZ74391.1 hypothetical protein QEN71_00825 [Paraburkholderia sabiae]
MEGQFESPSLVATRQRIGRGLRVKKFGPNVAFIVRDVDYSVFRIAA